MKSPGLIPPHALGSATPGSRSEWSLIWLHQYCTGSGSSSFPWLAGKDDFGAQPAAGGESSGDLGYLKPAVKLHSISDSFTGQKRDQIPIFVWRDCFTGVRISGKLQVWCAYGLCMLMSKTQRKNSFFSFVVVYCLWGNNKFQMRIKTKSLRKSCRDFILLSFRSVIKKQTSKKTQPTNPQPQTVARKTNTTY